MEVEELFFATGVFVIAVGGVVEENCPLTKTVVTIAMDTNAVPTAKVLTVVLRFFVSTGAGSPLRDSPFSDPC